MRLSYFALDRADVRERERSMAKPTPGSLRDLKKVARLLIFVATNVSEVHLNLR